MMTTDSKPDNVTDIEDAEMVRWLTEGLSPARRRALEGPAADIVAGCVPASWTRPRTGSPARSRPSLPNLSKPKPAPSCGLLSCPQRACSQESLRH